MRSLLAVKIGVGVMLLAAQGHAVQAAEIKGLSVPALKTSGRARAAVRAHDRS
jgi:hypothetical protein